MNSVNKKILLLVLDTVPDGVHVASGEGITLNINKAFERITGVSRNHIVGGSTEELFKQKSFMKTTFLEAVKSKNVVSRTLILDDKRRVLISCNPMFDANLNIEYLVTYIRDISELTSIKDSKKKLESFEKMKSESALRKPEALNPELLMGENSLRCFKLAKRVAATDAKILIQGETGTGKTLLARYIHDNSLRSNAKFLSLNCAAMPEGLIEAELFGYSKGAFTGASSKGKEGLLSVADKGTLFLDEIGDLPLSLQAKLLKVLEENQFLPLGATQFRNTDFRLITATHHNLKKAVEEGRFREDLYYRIQVMPLEMPCLTERQDEIEPLLSYYLNHFSSQYRIEKAISEETLKVLKSYPWPGNIRELINLTEQLVLISDAKEIKVSDLPAHFVSEPKQNDEPSSMGNLNEQVARLELKMISNAIKIYGSTRAAAASLGINQSTLVKKRKQYQSLA